MRQRWLKWFSQRPSIHRPCTQPWHHFAFLVVWEAPHFSSRFASPWIPYMLELLDMFLFPTRKALNMNILTSSLRWRSKFLSFWSLLEKKDMVQTICGPSDPNSTQLSKAWVGLRCCCYPSWAFWDEGNETENIWSMGILHPSFPLFSSSTNDLSLSYACLEGQLKGSVLRVFPVPF